MDFEKVKSYLRVQIAAFKKLAELTEQTWDDAYAAKIESIFDSLFGPATMKATCGRFANAGCPVVEAVTSAGLPAWLVPLLIQVGQELLRRLLAS